MIFSALPLTEATGGYLGHSLKIKSSTGVISFAKGHLLSKEDITQIKQANNAPSPITELIVAKLENGDVHEDVACARLAGHFLSSAHSSTSKHMRLTKAHTGRINLIAEASGIVEIDVAAIHQFNLVSEEIALATLNEFARIQKGQIIATLKIIPFAVHEKYLQRAESILENRQLFHLHSFKPLKVALIQTDISGVSTQKRQNKAHQVIAERIKALTSHITRYLKCNHDCPSLEKQLSELRHQDIDLILILGASAITDRRDIIPQSIQNLSGKIIHFGMPVDPGNLALLASLDRTPIVGLPGCASSPQINGFDWILERLCAGISLSSQDIASMGVGGLLKDIKTRPLPRHKISPQ